MKFNIITFGCKVNQSESESIITDMINNGFEFIDSNSKEKPEIVIINSCTVTAESDRKLRQCIHRVRRENENSIIVLIGCMPQAFPKIAYSFEDIQIVLGNTNKQKVSSCIKEYLQNKIRILRVEEINHTKKFEETLPSCSKERYRAFLKIQDGCDRFCSYCIIPYARGRVRSKPLDIIKNDVINLCNNGYKEIVLTGINLSSYGKDLNCTLYEAVKLVCDIEGVERVRLGSLEPDLMTETLIDNLSKEKKLCPQFHLSLQSGSNTVLKKMRRLYTREEYLNVVRIIKNKIPNATFTTDIMVGFSGETEDDFQESINIISEVGFIKVHVFPYSLRPGTLAEKFGDTLSRNKKTQRVQKIIEISNKISKIIMEGFIDFEMDVLYETLDSDGFYKGYTSNYIPVKTKSNFDIRGKIIKTILKSVDKDFCIGIIK